MVATLVRLRWSIVLRQLKRDWWRVLFVLAGAVWSLSLVPTVIFAHLRLTSLSNELRQDALVAIAAVLALGWALLPVLATGVDDTLDPTRFAPWGSSARVLLPGLTVAAFTTVPASFFVIVAIILGASWRGAQAGPLVTVAGVIGATLTVVSWVLSARLSALWATRLLATRAAKFVVAMLAVVPVASIFWLGISIQSRGFDQVIGGEVNVALKALANTPIGAGMSIASALAGADYGATAWRVAVAIAWVGLLWLAWRDAVAHALVHPLTRSAVSVRSRDAVLALAPHALGHQRQVKVQALLAVVARSLRSWFSDQRYVVHAIGAFVFPALLAAGLFVAGEARSEWILVVPVLAAMSVGWGRHNDIALDGSALWLDLVSGVPGRIVLAARFLAVMVWAVPSVVAIAVLAVVASSRWDMLPLVIAAAIAGLCAALAVSTIASVVLPYQVPAAGDSPFGQDTGSLGASLAGQAVSSAGTAIVVPFAVAPAAAALLWGGWWIPVSVLACILIAGLTPIIAIALTHSLWQERTGRLLSKVS